jgi:glyoxylase-like metal-dependent hydrolase (beta-lactamase superfamily II)
MWDRSIGQKGSRLYVVGTSSVPLYLYRLDDGWALFEGGLAVMGPLLLRQLTEIVGDLSAVRYWFITHAHYDHCALVPKLIRQFPHATVVLSEKAAEAFRSISAQRVVMSLNKAIADSWQDDGPHPSGIEEVMSPWESVPVRVVSDGESLELGGGVKVKAVATPGHSRCSMSYFVEPEGLLMVSDAMGEVVAISRFLPLVFDDAAAYSRSLETLGRIRPAIVGLGHHGILMGAAAASAAEDAAASLVALREIVRTRAREGDRGVSLLAEELTRDHWGSSRQFLPERLHGKSMVRMLELLT